MMTVIQTLDVTLVLFRIHSVNGLYEKNQAALLVVFLGVLR